MPFVLNASSPSAYAINGYNSAGVSSLLANPTSGAFGVTGTFHSNLADLSKLTGQKSQLHGNYHLSKFCTA